MAANQHDVYKFDGFRLDTINLALYHSGVLVDNGGKKALQILAVLLRKNERVVSHQQLIDEVWGTDAFGVRPDHVNHYVSKLRGILSAHGPGEASIESVKGRGYVFHGEVVGTDYLRSSDAMVVPEFALAEDNKTAVESEEIENVVASTPPAGSISRYLVVAALASTAVLAAVLFAAYWTGYWSNDDEMIRQVVKDSQLFESLVLYRNPTAFNEADMNKYWTAESDINSNEDRRRIKDSIKKLVAEGRHYGPETKCEIFEFQSVELNGQRDFATVRTLEKWFIADYGNDGLLLKNKYVGPYFVSYVLRKTDGRWLIERSTTARTTRPVPTLAEIIPVDAATANSQFLVRVMGQDFESETVFLELTGPGCPESRPCKVANSILREHARITAGELLNVPLTLAAGEFRVVVRNGDSHPSNPLGLSVR